MHREIPRRTPVRVTESSNKRINTSRPMHKGKTFIVRGKRRKPKGLIMIHKGPYCAPDGSHTKDPGVPEPNPNHAQPPPRNENDNLKQPDQQPDSDNICTDMPLIANNLQRIIGVNAKCEEDGERKASPGIANDPNSADSAPQNLHVYDRITALLERAKHLAGTDDSTHTHQTELQAIRGEMIGLEEHLTALTQDTCQAAAHEEKRSMRREPTAGEPIGRGKKQTDQTYDHFIPPFISLTQAEVQMLVHSATRVKTNLSSIRESGSMRTYVEDLQTHTPTRTAWHTNWLN